MEEEPSDMCMTMGRNYLWKQTTPRWWPEWPEALSQHLCKAIRDITLGINPFDADFSSVDCVFDKEPANVHLACRVLAGSLTYKQLCVDTVC
jgi:hypothetical protein